MDNNYLIQRKLIETKPPANRSEVAKKVTTCESVEFDWISYASNFDQETSHVQGTNMKVSSQGMEYTFVYHPGNKNIRIDYLGTLSMSFAPRIGDWHYHTLLMNHSGFHKWSIEGYDVDGHYSSWEYNFYIPGWFNGKPSDVSLKAYDSYNGDKTWYHLTSGSFFFWVSPSRSWHLTLFYDDYQCDEPLIPRRELSELVLNSFESCTAFGDIHIMNFPNEKQDFQASGIYTQTKSLARSMEVQVYQCPFAGGTSVPTGVAIMSGPHNISFIRGQTRINGVIAAPGDHVLAHGTDVVVSVNQVQVLGPTTRSGYGKVQASATMRPDTGTGYIVKSSVSMPFASVAFSDGECASEPSWEPVTASESAFYAADLVELQAACETPEGWTEASTSDTAQDICNHVECAIEGSELFSSGSQACKDLEGDFFDTCVLDYCAMCGDPSAAVLSAEAAATQNNVVFTPEVINAPISEEAMSPTIATAHCQAFGSGHLKSWDNNLLNVPNNGVVDLVNSDVDNFTVQLLACPFANSTVGVGWVAVAVKMYGSLFVARGPYVTVNNVTYESGTHTFPTPSGNITMTVKFGLISIKGPPKFLGRASVQIRALGTLITGEELGDPTVLGVNGVTNVLVKLPASNVAYSQGACKEMLESDVEWSSTSNSDWYWPDTNASSKRRAKLVRPKSRHGSLFEKADVACPNLNTLTVSDVADVAGKSEAEVTTEDICTVCDTLGWENATIDHATTQCESLLDSTYHDCCMQDFCTSCGSENVSMVQASLDAYIIHTSSGEGTGSWPSGLHNPNGWGDPHVRNVKGETFDVHTSGWVQMVRIPRDADPKAAELLVMADLASIQANNSCSPTLIHMLQVNGSRLGGNPLAVKIGPHGTPQVVSSRLGFKEKKRGPRTTLEKDDITIATFNNSAYPASKGLLHVKIGKYSLVVRQRLRSRFSYFDLDVQGILESETDVGGLLGLDDHKAEAQVPEQCVQTAATVLHRGEDEDMAFDSKMMSTVTLL